MAQLHLFLTQKHSKQRPSQTWWAHLTEAKRLFSSAVRPLLMAEMHKMKPYAFIREGGQLIILSEYDLISKSYKRKHNV